MKLEPRLVSIENLLLDPNNYRFHDIDAWKRVNEARFHEQKAQENTNNLLRSTPVFELSALKDSIRTNGLVPLEQIVVRQYHEDTTKYVVVEGNRRVAAIKWLLEDAERAIVDLTQDEINKLQQINVLFLDISGSENENAVQVLMAIRHVSGVKEWGAYQQARLIVELLSKPGATFKVVSERLGMSSREVARRFRASKALQQMETDEEYKDYVEPKMYAIFHELVAQPTLRDWLNWDDDAYRFTNRTNLYDFYSLICETEDRKAKITGYEDVRTKLKTIVVYPRALQVLLDADRDLDLAYQVAIEESGLVMGANNFETAIRAASKALDDLPMSKLRNLSDDARTTMQELAIKIQRTLEDYKKLREA